ncbi:hypothetical protein KXS07_03900 [Inquilinus limosus]|uniref:hypothetical protein n=1 Tax=Inquilinus limosus TaxID=171674 RepID=UPI003F174383
MPELEKPYIIQGSEKPIIRIAEYAGSNLMCLNCNESTLIDGYHPDNFLALRIKCSRCGHVTETPSLVDNEILPAKLMSLGDSGVYRLSDTAESYEDLALTCHQEIQRVNRLMGPRSAPPNTPVTADTIENLISEYNIWSGNSFDSQLASVQRAVAAGHLGYSEFPFAWACLRLRRAVSERSVDLRNPLDAIALRAVLSFGEVAQAWGHHPRIHEIGRSLVGAGTFWHNVIQLAVAAYLFSIGNPVNINLAATDGTRVSDLYIRSSVNSRLGLEIKTPSGLCWPADATIKQAEIERIVNKQLKSAKGQINKRNNGVLIIGSVLVGTDISDKLGYAIQKILNSKGRDHRGVAAVIGFSSAASAFIKSNRQLFSIKYKFATATNPHYLGDNPIQIEPQPVPTFGQEF